MWGVHEGMGWWMLFGGLWMLLFWAIVIGAIVWAISQVVGGGKERRQNDALEIARQRYARGAINREEFERIASELTGTEGTIPGAGGGAPP
ncbi:MAG: SHOCT domain-containing protein [Chloroflexi bacterium]|nr:SHOCT domain-containing protein [Chloroflexota bacterium]